MRKIATTNKRGVRKRGEILKKARELFWSKSFSGTTIKDIAVACRCAQGNIYNHFRNKEDILYEILLSDMEYLIGTIQPLEDDCNTSPIVQLRVFIDKHLEFILTPHGKGLLYFEAEVEHLTLPHQKEIIKWRDAYDRILRKIIRRGIDAGLFSEVSEKLVDFAISSLIVRVRLWYSSKGELSLSELSRAISDLFLNGLKTRAETLQEVESTAFLKRKGGER